MVRGFIFDLDGTVLDSMYLWEKVDRDFLAAYGIEADTEYLDTMKSLNFAECVVYTRSRYHLPVSDGEMMEMWDRAAHDIYAHDVQLKKGVKGFLRCIKNAGARISVATSGYASLFMPALERCGIAEFFDAYTTKDDALPGKGEPDIYYAASKKIGCSKEECIVFEDLPRAILTLKNAGFRAVGVYDTYFDGDSALIKENCEIYIRDFTDRRLENILKEIK